ncbi:AAA family ATPase [Rhodococcus opacus]|uniref:Toprim domain-containing protein n=1 Tax=Rhodococcus opacus (strain B4) TaxID=632772 RepID=C1B982_RHOOB|nr:AAA family ATPase [Rhodococcus opacus]BAH52235.1 hypothetical protein ROP_39880 [Rhodococcus opacus B4]
MTALDRLRDHWHSQGLVWQDQGADTSAAQAPGHSSADRSVTFRQIAGQVLMNSHADDKDTVLTAIGLTTADLFDDPKGAEYRYSDGRTVIRTPAKKFRQSGNTSGTALYRAEKLADHQTGSPVYVAEGEKDVHALESLGAVAVCSAMGAGKAKRFDWSPLAGHTVVIVADRDEPGEKHAAQVLEILQPIAEAVVVVTATTGKDAADHIAAGHGLDEFQVVETVTSQVVGADNLGFRSVTLSPFANERDDVPVWAWTYGDKGRVPLGALALFAGRPGAGKSTAGRWFAASASTGTLAGHWEGKPVNVAYIAAEESAKYVVKPGLRAAGADLNRVFMPKVEINGEEVRFLSSHDMEDLTEQLKAAEVKLVVVDPLMSTIGSKTDINRNNEVRSLVEPWAKLAEKIDGVVLGIAHLNKSGNGDVVAGINGSSAFGEVARSVFGFAKDPESDEGDRIMSQEKNSIGEEDLALTYRIESASVTTDSGKSADVGRFVIIGDSDRIVGDVLRSQPKAPWESGGHDGIDEWLLNLLATGPMLAKDVYDSANAAGYSTDKAKRAKSRINKDAETIDAFRPKIPGPWFWQRLDCKGAETAEECATPERAAPLLSSAPLQVTGGNQGDADPQGSKGAREHASTQDDEFAFCPACHKPIGRSGKCVSCIVSGLNKESA